AVYLGDGDDDEYHDEDAQRVAEPAGGRTQLSAQQYGQTGRVTFVHLGRCAPMRRRGAHLSITTTAEAPRRIRPSGGASIRILTGKRAAIRTQLSVLSTCGRPPKVALTLDATPQPRLSTRPRSGRSGCAIT